MAAKKRRARTSQPRPSRAPNPPRRPSWRIVSAPVTTATFACPLCGSASADVTPKPPESYPEGGFWIGCFKCQANGLRGGNYLRDLAKAVGANGGAALLDHPHKYLSTREAKVGPYEPEPTLAEVEGKHQRLLASPQPLAYLIEQRGLSLAIIKEARIGWDGKRLYFPFSRRREPVGYKTRLPRAKAKMRNCSGRERPWPLYPEPEGNWDWCLLVAGEFDALRGRSVGLPTASVPLGAGMWREEWEDTLRPFELVVVCFDNNEHEIADERAKQLRAAGINAVWLDLRRMKLTRPKGDLEDYLDKKCDDPSVILRFARRARKEVKTG